MAEVVALYGDNSRRLGLKVLAIVEEIEFPKSDLVLDETSRLVFYATFIGTEYPAEPPQPMDDQINRILALLLDGRRPFRECIDVLDIVRTTLWARRFGVPGQARPLKPDELMFLD